MRYATIGRYQFSAGFLLIIAVACSVMFAATCYLWTRKTVTFSVHEPLSTTGFPSSIHFHPNENVTLNITVLNSATVSYSAVLNFVLNDTAYQQSYLQFSNYTYIIAPGTNEIFAWVLVASDAPGGWHELAVDCQRV